MTEKKLSKSTATAAKVIYAALQALKDNGGELPSSSVFNEVEKRVEFDAWEKNQYETTGNIRWRAILSFHSIGPIKAGFLVKKKGIWYLTPEGEAALKLGSMGLLNATNEAYKKWSKENPRKTVAESEETVLEGEGVPVAVEENPPINLDQIEQMATESLNEYIKSKNAYEVQDLVAALLRGMGYYTPFVAPKGKDGGVDIIGYRDPLGTVSPRIKVQVKHRQSTPATVQEIRQLIGLLQKDGDVGLFVSTYGFSPDAKATARNSHVHVELIDLQRLVSLWQEFYPKLTDEDKNRLPLLPIFFLAPSE